MTERRKILDEELVEISGGIDLPLEDLERRRRESKKRVRESDDAEGNPGGHGPGDESVGEGGGDQSLG